MFEWKRTVQAAALGATIWAIVGSLLFVTVSGLDSHQRHLFDALKSSKMTAGTLVSKDTANHGSFEYSYIDLLGHRHLGGGSGEGQEQGDPADLAVGTEITVWYSSAHPTVSCYCTPAENPPHRLFVKELLISQFLAVPLGILAGVAFWVRRRRKLARVRTSGW